jgi:hypothetical protein
MGFATAGGRHTVEVVHMWVHGPSYVGSVIPVMLWSRNPGILSANR